MSSNAYVLIDGLLSFGVVVAICVWQLRSTARAKAERIAREKALKEKSEGR